MGNWEVIVHHSSKFPSVLLAVPGVPSVRILGGIGKARMEGGEAENRPSSGQALPPSTARHLHPHLLRDLTREGSRVCCFRSCFAEEQVSVCKREEKGLMQGLANFSDRARQ